VAFSRDQQGCARCAKFSLRRRCRPHEETTLAALSPREIQSRVRAGESAETIAADTGWPLDRVMRYAEPLLDERAYVAGQARAVEIRRSGGGATLEQSAATVLGVPVDGDAITWDAWRRDDGRWIVSARYLSRGKAQVATWSFDPAGRNVHPLDDRARGLMGVPVDEADPIADALDLVSERVPERPHLVAVPDEPEAPVDARSDTAVISLPVPDEPGEPTAPPAPAVAEKPAAAPAAKPAKAARPKGKRGRASVPSWDEILFGATKSDD
jgi:hypothetical protein